MMRTQPANDGAPVGRTRHSVAVPKIHDGIGFALRAAYLGWNGELPRDFNDLLAKLD